MDNLTTQFMISEIKELRQIVREEKAKRHEAEAERDDYEQRALEAEAALYKEKNNEMTTEEHLKFKQMLDLIERTENARVAQENTRLLKLVTQELKETVKKIEFTAGDSLGEITADDINTQTIKANQFENAMKSRR